MPVEAEPDVARSPLQFPEAVQVSASVDDQLSVALPPLMTLVGLIVSATVGIGEGVTPEGVAAVSPVATPVALPPLQEARKVASNIAPMIRMLRIERSERPCFCMSE